MDTETGTQTELDTDDVVEDSSVVTETEEEESVTIELQEEEEEEMVVLDQSQVVNDDISILVDSAVKALLDNQIPLTNLVQVSKNHGAPEAHKCIVNFLMFFIRSLKFQYRHQMRRHQMRRWQMRR